MKRFSRIIAVAACASWASGGLAYTFNPIGDIYWKKPVLSSLPDDWQAMITESQNVQHSGAGGPGSICAADGTCTDLSSGLDFSGGANLADNGGLGFSGRAHLPPLGVNPVDHGPVFIPNTVDAPHASGVQQSCEGTALGLSNSRLCRPSSSEPGDDPATEPTVDSDGSSTDPSNTDPSNTDPSNDEVSNGSAGGFYSDPADNGNGDPYPGQEQASADVDAPATLALMVLGLATLMFYRKPIRRSA